MPWSASDAASHTSGLTPAQSEAWAKIANSALESCRAKGDPDCEGSAIRIANAGVKKVGESAIAAFVSAIAEALPWGDRDVEEKEREFSSETRSAYADKGVAMEDGSFPIPDKDALRRAIASIGRAKDRGAAMAHIKKRARALGATDMLPEDWKESASPADVEELMPLTERAIGADGALRVKLIGPGWGSSGYYTEEVLRRDGPKVWPKGTKMYADHPSISEERDRPERSIKDIAAVFSETPAWENDPRHGPGLYTRAKVVDTWRPHIEALIGNIDASIRAGGKVKQGEAEGRKGLIVEELAKGYSVDFVTSGGAGGKVISLAESAHTRRSQNENEIEEADLDKLEEANKKLEDQGKEIARLREKDVLRDAVTFVERAVLRTDLPDITKARLLMQLASNPPVKDGALDEAALTTRVNDAVKTEREYIGKIVGQGVPRGFGATTTADRDFTKELAEAFREMGHDEKTAAALAAGRGN